MLYLAAALLGIALVLPMAIASGQTKLGGLFDECYDRCGGGIELAEADG